MVPTGVFEKIGAIGASAFSRFLPSLGRRIYAAVTRRRRLTDLPEQLQFLAHAYNAGQLIRNFKIDENEPDVGRDRGYRGCYKNTVFARMTEYASQNTVPKKFLAETSDEGFVMLALAAFAARPEPSDTKVILEIDPFLLHPNGQHKVIAAIDRIFSTTMLNQEEKVKIKKWLRRRSDWHSELKGKIAALKRH